MSEHDLIKKFAEKLNEHIQETAEHNKEWAACGRKGDYYRGNEHAQRIKEIERETCFLYDMAKYLNVPIRTMEQLAKRMRNEKKIA